ncbi:MAG: phosphoenolpyruvate synthase [Thaumarchaeota archaeon]|jgi:pyruvate,water dikinase|nr:phosphoenolpyruvate synthase [Nitrososphaerota archaeon]NSL77572.1 phosphoenolpyruvate synthase [Nitrososphaerota archaeon]
MSNSYIRTLDSLNHKDGDIVGGKSANLGELLNAGLPVPGGFAITTTAYKELVIETESKNQIHDLLNNLDMDDFDSINSCSAQIRELIEKIPLPEALISEIQSSYRSLGDDIEVAVRSSATAEDLPSASFAGQMDSFLYIKGIENVLKSVKKCISSVFSSRAISYRHEKNFDHFIVLASVTIQKMLDPESAGVMFTLNPVTGATNEIYIEGSWGVGETIVQGKVDPDSFIVQKPELNISSRNINTKKLMTIRGATQGKFSIADRASATEIDVPLDIQNKPSIDDNTVKLLSDYAVKIEKHYNKPMDIEWVLEKNSHQIFIVQARPETVHSKPQNNNEIILKGIGASSGVSFGPVNVILDIKNTTSFINKQVLVTQMTTPDWTPIMKRASAIITQSGGATAHAAIVSRELGIPCIVGAKDATNILKTGQEVTVDGSTGCIYDGKVEIQNKSETQSSSFESESWPITATQIYMNLGSPDLIDKYKFLPFDGIGLMRLEFLIADKISKHPLKIIEDNESDKFVNELFNGINKVASTIFPRPLVVRFSDFKSNEYRKLEGGEKYEPHEENPMIGWRGISRYISPDYQPAFRLECKAIKKLRDAGMSNVWVMLPFARTIPEVKETLKIMQEEGLERSDDFKVWLMAETPSLVIQADDFAKLCDGFSIGSNDLTQLMLGVDRDSELLHRLGYFNERDPAVLKAIKSLIRAAHDNDITISICGQAPSLYPDFAALLVKEGIDSISANPDSVIRTRRSVAGAERKELLRLRQNSNSE